MTQTANPPVASLSTLPPEVRARAERQLEPGERVVWLTQPAARLAARSAWVSSVLAVPITAYAVYMTVKGVHSQGAFGGLFVAPFILLGIAMFFAPALARRAAAGSVYLLTDRRAVIVRPALFGLRTSVRSYRPERLGSMACRERPDGSGDLIFEQQTTRDSDGDKQTVSYGFMGVEAVRDVERRVRETLLPGRTAPVQA